MLTEVCKYYVKIVIDSNTPFIDLAMLYDIGEENKKEDGIILEIYYALEYILLTNRSPSLEYINGNAKYYWTNDYPEITLDYFNDYPYIVPQMSTLFGNVHYPGQYREKQYNSRDEAFYDLVFNLILNPAILHPQ